MRLNESKKNNNSRKIEI